MLTPTGWIGLGYGFGVEQLAFFKKGTMECSLVSLDPTQEGYLVQVEPADMMQPAATHMGLKVDSNVLFGPVHLLPHHLAAVSSLTGGLTEVSCPRQQALGLGSHSSDA